MRRLTWAQNLTEAEMIAGLLAQEGIEVVIQRQPGLDAPEFLGGGPRILFVDEERHAEASEVVDAHFGLR